MSGGKYHNTNKESGSVLAKSEIQVVSQEAMVLRVFAKHPKQAFAPHEIQKMLPVDYPLTSVRRAITNLTEAFDLQKTDVMKPGLYGKLVHTWQFPTWKQVAQWRR